MKGLKYWPHKSDEKFLQKKSAENIGFSKQSQGKVAFFVKKSV